MAVPRRFVLLALIASVGEAVASQSVFVSEPTHLRTGWSTFPVLTRGESVPLIGGAVGQSFEWTEQHRQWDGLGACVVDPGTIRVYLNMEMSPGGTILRLDLGAEALNQWITGRVPGNGNANQAARPAGLVRGMAAAWQPVDAHLIDRPCSGNVWEPHAFGYERGFHDRLYLSGEETFAEGGHFQVIDPQTQMRYEARDVGGGGSWENASLIDTGRSDTIALLLGEDQGDSPLGTAPLSLYVGRKNPAGGFLERNGLVGGTTYYWDADGTDTTIGSLYGSLFGGGAGTRAAGHWTTDRVEAVLFSKAEDVHVDTQPGGPGFGVRAALASQGQGVFLVDCSGLEFVAGDLGSRRQSEVTVLFAAGTDQGDGSGSTGLFDAMDNLVWSANGRLYINEDDGEGDIWEIAVDALLAEQAAGILAPQFTTVRQILDADPIAGLGINESSGIIDISTLVGYVPGSVLLTNGMGSVADQLAMLVSPAAARVPAVTTITVASGAIGQRAAGHPILAGTATVLKEGGGTLVLDQINTLTGRISVQSGGVRVAHPRALAGATLVPLAGGTASLEAAVAIDLAGLEPLAGGLLDVGAGLATVSAGLATTDLLEAIRLGRGGGAWDGATGITSAAAAAAADTRGVGWRDDAERGIVLGFAALGDTNLDWMVDLLDAATIVAAGRFDTSRPATWQQGDFTYDGRVDILDIAAFMATDLFDAGPYNPGASSAVAIAVPEPAATAMAVAALMIAGISRSGRRRGRRPGFTP
jgi:autotransporter-associated beta strand protein